MLVEVKEKINWNLYTRVVVYNDASIKQLFCKMQ